MRLPKILALGLLGRRALSELTGIREQLAQQNALLARLANHFAPIAPRTDQADVLATTGVDHLDPIEAGIVLDYVERTRHDTGHEPNGDEILTYLADERTTDLHARMIARHREIEALQSRSERRR